MGASLLNDIYYFIQISCAPDECIHPLLEGKYVTKYFHYNIEFLYAFFLTV